MSISTLAQLRSCQRQRVTLSNKTVTSNQLEAPAAATLRWHSLWFIGGVPSAGSSPNNTTTGVVPTNATTGAPSISSFSGQTGYVTRVDITASDNEGNAPWRFFLCDLLFWTGPYAASAGLTTLSSQPSYSSRLPTVGGNPDYTGLSIWQYIDSGTISGTKTLTVGYTDQDGNPGHSTGSVTFAGLRIGHMTQFPLAAGDVGVQKIESVNATAGGSGNSGVMVIRKIGHALYMPENSVPQRITRHWDESSLTQVFSDSCLMLVLQGNNVLSNAQNPTMLATCDISIR